MCVKDAQLIHDSLVNMNEEETFKRLAHFLSSFDLTEEGWKCLSAQFEVSELDSLISPFDEHSFIEISPSEFDHMMESI